MTARMAGMSSDVWTISGELYRGIPNRDIISIYEGSSVLDLTGLQFELQLRCSFDQDSADLVLSTDDGLTITTAPNDAGDNIDVIQLDDVDLSALSAGEYFADFVMKDEDDVYTYLAQGALQIRNSPVTPTI